MTYADIVCTVIGFLLIAGAAVLCWAIAVAEDEPESGVVRHE